MTDQPLNLDQTAAIHAQQMVNEAEEKIDTLERLVTKSLGVLQEQGVYALMLFLFSRTSDEKKIAPVICKQLRLALAVFPCFSEEKAVPDTDDQTFLLPFFANHVADEMDILFLVRDLFEQTLIYARFGAKAAGKE